MCVYSITFHINIFKIQLKNATVTVIIGQLIYQYSMKFVRLHNLPLFPPLFIHQSCSVMLYLVNETKRSLSLDIALNTPSQSPSNEFRWV